MSTIKELIESTVHEVCQWQPGSVIVRQGCESDSLILVLAGELQVWLERDDRADRIDTIGPGGVVGEAELLAPGPATATIATPGGAWGLRIRSAELARLWERAPKLARELHSRALVTLMGRLREANCEQEQRAALRERKVGGPWTSLAS
jgi:CRP-like cAMP-binding protein